MRNLYAASATQAWRSEQGERLGCPASLNVRALAGAIGPAKVHMDRKIIEVGNVKCLALGLAIRGLIIHGNRVGDPGNSKTAGTPMIHVVAENTQDLRYCLRLRRRALLSSFGSSLSFQQSYVLGIVPPLVAGRWRWRSSLGR